MRKFSQALEEALDDRNVKYLCRWHCINTSTLQNLFALALLKLQDADLELAEKVYDFLFMKLVKFAKRIGHFARTRKIHELKKFLDVVDHSKIENDVYIRWFGRIPNNIAGGATYESASVSDVISEIVVRLRELLNVLQVYGETTEKYSSHLENLISEIKSFDDTSVRAPVRAPVRASVPAPVLAPVPAPVRASAVHAPLPAVRAPVSAPVMTATVPDRVVYLYILDKWMLVALDLPQKHIWIEFSNESGVPEPPDNKYLAYIFQGELVC